MFLVSYKKTTLQDSDMPVLRKSKKHNETSIAYDINNYYNTQEAQKVIKLNEIGKAFVREIASGQLPNNEVEMYNNILLFSEKINIKKLHHSSGTTYTYNIQNHITIISRDFMTDLDYNPKQYVRDVESISIDITLLTQFDCTSIEQSSRTKTIHIPINVYNLRIAETPYSTLHTTEPIGTTSNTLKGLREAHIISRYITQLIKVVNSELPQTKISAYSRCSIIISLYNLIVNKLKVLYDYIKSLEINNKVETYLKLISKYDEYLAKVLENSGYLLRYFLLSQILLSEEDKKLPFYTSNLSTYLVEEESKICWPSGKLIVNEVNPSSMTVTMLL